MGNRVRSGEQGAENRDKRTELREQIARSREHEAGIGEQKRRTPNLPSPIVWGW